MELSHAQELAVRLINTHLPEGWSFGWIKTKRSYGQCDYKLKQIALSSILTQHRTEHGVTQTLLHEVAHALTPGHGHDAVWRRVARQLGVERPRSSTNADFDRAAVPYTWAIMYNDEIIKGYHRRPNKRTISSIPHMQLVGQPSSHGKLKLVKL